MESYLLHAALKGRLIRQPYMDAKKRCPPRCQRLFHQAEQLLPNSFEIIDEAFSNAYLRLFPSSDSDPNSRLLILIQILFLIQISWIQAALRSLLVLAGVYGKADSPWQGVMDVVRYLQDRCLDLMHLLINTYTEICQLIDHDADGHISLSDILHTVLGAISYIRRVLTALISILSQLVRILFNQVVDVICPPPTRPSPPDALLHQNSPNKISTKLVDRFQRRSESPTTLARVVYDGLAACVRAWIGILAAGAGTLWSYMLRVLEWMRDALQMVIGTARIAWITSC